jgi:hypothetical protein
MATEEITIPVDSDAAKAFREASPAEQKVFGEWFASHLKRANRPKDPSGLLAVMDEISSQAKARGLTPEILQQILADE